MTSHPEVRIFSGPRDPSTGLTAPMPSRNCTGASKRKVRSADDENTLSSAGELMKDDGMGSASRIVGPAKAVAIFYLRRVPRRTFALLKMTSPHGLFGFRFQLRDLFLSDLSQLFLDLRIARIAG